jgi:aminoglycoside phosphotransferase (APT) family kinase protein
MLSQPEAVRYLLDRGLLTAATVVDGDLSTRDFSSRNVNLSVSCAHGPSYMLKQGQDKQGVLGVLREAEIYNYLSAIDGLQRYLPRFYHYDKLAQLLVLEFLTQGGDLRHHHYRRGRFSASLAAVLGRALSTLHSATRNLAVDVDSDAHTAPSILSLHRPSADIFRDFSVASIELIKIIQQTPTLCAKLDDLRREWRCESLIHFDIKWDNLIVVPGPGPRQKSLKIIDWEMARLGDACWDIGSAIGNYLSWWIFSIPVTGQAHPEQFPALARYPLAKMRPAIARCWQSYIQDLELDAASIRQLVLKTTGYAAVRLVQTAFEAAQVSAELNSSLILHLQLADNILNRTPEAAVHLLGLPVYAAMT